MSTTATTTRMTAEEFFEFCTRPENRDRRFELVRGEVVELSRSGERHGFVCQSVGGLLGNSTQKRRQGYVLGNNTGVILDRDPDTVLGPDISVYDDVKRYADLSPRYCERPPTLAAEVLSPNDPWPKALRRASLLLGRGVAVVWLVDPEYRTVTVLRPKQLPQVYEGDEELTGEPELPGFRYRTADFFYLPGEEEALTPDPKP